MSNPVIVANGRVISGNAVVLSKAQMMAARLLAPLSVDAWAILMETVKSELEQKQQQRQADHQNALDRTSRLSSNGSVPGVHRTYNDMIVEKLSK